MRLLFRSFLFCFLFSGENAKPPIAQRRQSDHYSNGGPARKYSDDVGRGGSSGNGRRQVGAIIEVNRVPKNQPRAQRGGVGGKVRNSPKRASLTVISLLTLLQQ